MEGLEGGKGSCYYRVNLQSQNQKKIAKDTFYCSPQILSNALNAWLFNDLEYSRYSHRWKTVILKGAEMGVTQRLWVHPKGKRNQNSSTGTR